MVFCEQCGAANDPGSVSCYVCGAMLSPTQSVKQKKSIPVKPLLIIGGALLAVALIVGIVILILSGGKRDLESSFEKTMGAFWGSDVEPQPKRFMQQLGEMLEDGSYTTCLSIGPAGEFRMENTISRDDKKLRGSMSILDSQWLYYIDNKNIQFSIPGTLDNVYGASIKDLDKLLNNPLITTALGTGIDVQSFHQGLFAENDMDSLMGSLAGDAYDDFRESIEIKELDERRLNGWDCKVYQISWSDDAVTKMITAMGSMGMLSQYGDYIASLIPDLGSNCICYVNNKGYLMAVDFAAAGAQCLFMLEGRDNPWDYFTLTINSIYGDTVVYDGGLERSGDVTRFYLGNSETQFLTLEYNDDNGDFVLYGKGGILLLKGRMDVSGENLTLALGWDISSAPVVTMTIQPARTAPQALAKNHIDLLDWNIADLTRLIMDLKPLLEMLLSETK